jgi:prepilin-type processing-associated H-X9-DG protein
MDASGEHLFRENHAMPIDFTCPHCGAQRMVEDQYAGQSGPCASCGKTITVPGPGGAVGAAYAAPRPQGSSGASVLVIVLIVAVVVLVACGGILMALLLPAVSAARESARRAQCSNNLRQIGLAMHNYEASHMRFPAAAGPRKPGGPPVSWRVHLLPYIEYHHLYQQYDFEEPWDDPANAGIAGTAIMQYRCPSDGGSPVTETNYVGIVGPETALPADRGVGLQDFRDGANMTILVTEKHQSGIAWPEPRDLDAATMPMSVNDPSRAGPSSPHRGGVNAAFADGSVRFLDNSIDPEVLRAMTTRSGQETVPIPY